MRLRENSSIANPGTISQRPPREVTVNEEMKPGAGLTEQDADQYVTTRWAYGL